MLEISRLDIGPAAAIIAVTLILIASQILLLIKVKNLWVRLIPVFVLLLAVCFSAIMFSFAKGWDGVGYVLIMTFSFYILILDLLVIAAFAIIGALKKHRQL